MTLPAFLLATADWPGLWKGCSRFRPAQDTRWSWCLVLGMTAGYMLMAICIGLLLSLLFYRQPVAWMMWLTGSYMAAAGLCWFGLSALCWNQRAARLRANPALVSGLAPLKFRLFRWGLGLIYFVLIALVTPLAILLTIENVRGELAWRSERARLVAQGERLTFKEILGPEIPADQNAGAARIVAPFFDYQYLPREDGRGIRAAWRDTNALNLFDFRVTRPEKHLPKDYRSAHRNPEVNLEEWAEAYRAMVASPTADDPPWARELRLPPALTDPARVVLAGLAPANEVLAAICAASTRPRAQFPIHYHEAADALLRHLSSLKAVNQTLELRCAARLAAGEINAAFDDARCSFRASELLREEPLLISQLVRISSSAIAIRTLWQGLAEHRWTATQLAVFQDQLTNTSFLPGMVRAFEGERACGLLNLERCIRAPGSIAAELEDNDASSGIGRILALLPRGLIRQNEIALSRYHTAMLNRVRTALSNAPQTGLATAGERAASSAELEELAKTRSPYQLLAAQMAPAIGRAVLKGARAETILQMAVVACALEQFRLEHGAFPEKLEELVPALLPAAPLDPMNRQPFHYQRTADGWFQLYSVGPDGKDDGGVFIVKKGKAAEEKDWPWPVPSQPEERRLF